MTSGLRRFIVAEPTETATAAPMVQRCEMCGEPAGQEHEHGHVVDLKSRNILCACRPCYLLFTKSGAGGGRFRAIPQRYLYTPDFALASSTWNSIGIPVRMAFFFTNSEVGSTVAFYPSPAGATECLLPLGEWAEVIADNPEFADTEPDTEALLLNKISDRVECFIVPIDACYHLVGLVKVHWRGFDGGSEAWTAIDGFFENLRARAKKVDPHG